MINIKKPNIYQELIITLMLKHDLPFNQSYSLLSKVFFKAMSFDEQLRDKHKKNTFKFYTFSSLYPINKDDKVYRKGQIYLVRLRTFDTSLAVKMKHLLSAQDCGINVLATQLTTQSYRYIKSITTVTPIVSTIDGRCWTKEDGIGVLMERIQTNAVRKAQELDVDFQKPDDLFMQSIEILNRKPIIIDYKDSCLLGAKVKLEIADDPISQHLAFIAMGAGILEKNALGMGYCIATK